MTLKALRRHPVQKEFSPDRGYTKADWDDAESPEITDEQVARGRSFAQAFPDLAESVKRARGRPVSGKAKRVVSIRLDPEVIDKFKATGTGWHRRINDILKAAKLG